jgi:hypothetical protein
MKKLLFSTAFFISALGFSVTTNAQDYAFNKNHVTAVNPYNEKESKIVDEMDVNINAVRDFTKKYKNATGVKWVKNENGPSVYFVMDGVKMRSSYNTKGRKEYVLKYYDESKLPTEVRHLVRSTYYDYTIAIATEVVRNGNVSYLIKMENDKEYLTVKFDNAGEVSVFDRTTKVK